MNDTIAAIATPPGRGGVGIVRASGPQVKELCVALTNSLPTPRVAKYTDFLNANNQVIDTGLCLFFKGPNSFTGEDVLELHAHGGPVILDLLLRRLLELGARMARNGEFSERAFLNDKIDLLQAEAVAELINATSEQAALAANRSLQGEFSKKINSLVEATTHLRMYVEAAIDFPEEEIDFLADKHIAESVHNLLNELEKIYQQARVGAVLNEGINAVIVGLPNVGKSTLLNCLTGQDTAIVTPIAGTTRDTIKAQIDLDGVMLNIIDTAGLRETDDVVELEGIKRTKSALMLADLILLVVDLDATDAYNPHTLYPELRSLANDNAKILVVVNKIDKHDCTPFLQQHATHNVVAISAQKEQGLDLLRTQIKEIVGANVAPEGGLFLARRRHLDALMRAQKHIEHGSWQLQEFRAGELLAEELKQAQLALSEITGKFTPDDLLGRIFAEFCIGK